MSHWNNRVCKETKNGIVFYDIREVYYNDNNEIWAVTEDPIGVGCDVWDEEEVTEEDCIKDMKETVERFKRCFEKPIVDIDTIEYASLDDPIINDE